MHPEVYAAFDRATRDHRLGARVVELGAAAPGDLLLDLPAARTAGLRVALDLRPLPAAGMPVVVADTTRGLPFADGTFDTVLCNSVLEHVGRFWLAVDEMKRILRPGGLLAIGVPIFDAMGTMPHARFLRRLARLPGLRSRLRADREAMDASAPTLGLHAFPGDYYRFSRQAVTEILLGGLDVLSLDVVMQPPRAVGVARRRAG